MSCTNNLHRLKILVIQLAKVRREQNTIPQCLELLWARDIWAVVQFILFSSSWNKLHLSHLNRVQDSLASSYFSLDKKVEFSIQRIKKNNPFLPKAIKSFKIKALEFLGVWTSPPKCQCPPQFSSTFKKKYAAVLSRRGEENDLIN